MDTTFLSALFYTLISGILCLPILAEKEKKWSLILIFLSSVLVLEYLLYKSQFINSIFDLNLNWSGKVVTTILALIIIYLLKRRGDFDFGITLKQNKGSLKAVLTVFLIIGILEMLIVYFLYGSYDSSIEENLYQSSMPGISEEIIYRGLYLGLLNRIFMKRKMIFGASIGYAAIVTSIMFGMSHGISINENFQIDINHSPMVIPFAFGLIWVWMRERTGSLLVPILFHNFSNEIGQFLMKFK